jgi:hypothetical protein
VNTTSPIVLETTVVETWRQHARVGVTHSLNAGITTTRMKKIVVPNISVIRRGVLIRFPTKSGSGSGGVLTRRNLSQSLALLATTTGVVDILQMVFTNLTMAIHGNRITYRPLMRSMVVGGCRSINVVHSRGGYREPFVIMAPIFDYKDGHYVKLNKVTLKYLDFKKMLT